MFFRDENQAPLKMSAWEAKLLVVKIVVVPSPIRTGSAVLE